MCRVHPDATYKLTNKTNHQAKPWGCNFVINQYTGVFTVTARHTICCPCSLCMMKMIKYCAWGVYLQGRVLKLRYDFEEYIDLGGFICCSRGTEHHRILHNLLLKLLTRTGSSTFLFNLIHCSPILFFVFIIIEKHFIKMVGIHLVFF